MTIKTWKHASPTSEACDLSRTVLFQLVLTKARETFIISDKLVHMRKFSCRELEYVRRFKKRSIATSLTATRFTPFAITSAIQFTSWDVL